MYWLVDLNFLVHICLESEIERERLPVPSLVRAMSKAGRVWIYPGADSGWWWWWWFRCSTGETTSAGCNTIHFLSLVTNFYSTTCVFLWSSLASYIADSKIICDIFFLNEKILEHKNRVFIQRNYIRVSALHCAANRLNVGIYYNIFQGTEEV